MTSFTSSKSVKNYSYYCKYTLLKVILIDYVDSCIIVRIPLYKFKYKCMNTNIFISKYIYSYNCKYAVV